ncbi:MAG: ABC transporter permease [Cycloclasticus sp. symbiont of Poecilosclerida sp. N]|nr:MAG: ABC transporter permease [Cycloclasticus sp. symbiont of Poecilosclerida sp. N]
MLNYFQQLGVTSLGIFERLGRSSLFFVNILLSIPGVIVRPRLLIAQIYSVGVLSFSLILISGLFVGMVIALQGFYTLSDFGAEGMLGVMVAASLVRELGPVVSALLFAGRAGSALTAEIGLMKTTEQLSGMEMMAVDPIARIVTPRFLAGLISMPLLATVFSAIGILGGYFIGVGLLGIDEGGYWSQMQAKIDFNQDIINGLIKSVIFGWLVTWIAVFEGYDAIPTSEGVSRATTRTVVHSAFVILLVDFILTALMFGDI